MDNSGTVQSHDKLVALYFPSLLTDPQKDPVLYLFASYLDNHGGLPAFGNSRKAEILAIGPGSKESAIIG